MSRFVRSVWYAVDGARGEGRAEQAPGERVSCSVPVGRARTCRRPLFFQRISFVRRSLSSCLSQDGGHLLVVTVTCRECTHSACPRRSCWGRNPLWTRGPGGIRSLSPGFIREHAWAPGHVPCGTAAPSYHSDSLSPLKHLFFWQLPDAKYGTEDSFLISLGLVTFTCHH